MNQQLTSTGMVHHGTGSAVLRGGHFFLHFLEMCIAMMAGMAVFAPVKLALVSQGYTALLDTRSVDFQAWMNIFMVVPMVLWMRFRGCSWQDGAEMGAGMLVPVAVVLILCGLAHDAVPWLSTSMTGPLMFLGMLAVMVYRHDHYTHGYALRRWRHAMA
jgi:hypothetical protein